MGEGIQIQPATASVHASEMNWLFGGLLLTSAMILALVFGLIIVFCVRYRRNSPAERGNRLGKTWRLEVAWTSATFVLFLGLYFWGADLYVRLHQPPADASEIQVVAKQWMWKTEHPGGQREIDEPAHSGRSTGPAGDDVAGRDPQLRHSGLQDQAGRAARPVRDPLVHPDEGRRVPGCSARSSAAPSMPT